MNTTDLVLIVLGPMIPLLTSWFLTNLVAWQRDIAADWADAVEYDWLMQWDYWSARTQSTHPMIRNVARQMQGYLLATRPVEV